MDLTRRRFLAGLGVAAASALVAERAGAGLAARLEHHWLKVRHGDLDGRLIAHLTDLHCDGEKSAERIHQAVDLVNRCRPDLVLLTGDFVTWGTDYVERVATLLSRLRAPRFAVLGNHDHYAGAEAVTKALTAAGTGVLDNTSAVATLGAARVRLIGIGDANTGHENIAKAIDGVAADDDLRIALCHNPSSADGLPPGTADLILAGHTHGGQIRIEWLTPWVVRQTGSNYVSGFFDLPAGRLYVNRGWGTVGIPTRLGAPAEIALFHCRL
ncbi:MAG: metallophosphoesterase [Deltaproteobacteria bacterium]|nr:metallophosphoesterase [Deltaproteobacteria bacterium]